MAYRVADAARTLDASRPYKPTWLRWQQYGAWLFTCAKKRMGEVFARTKPLRSLFRGVDGYLGEPVDWEGGQREETLFAKAEQAPVFCEVVHLKNGPAWASVPDPRTRRSRAWNKAAKNRKGIRRQGALCGATLAQTYRGPSDDHHDSI